MTTPRTTDYAGGTLGWRVRIGSFTSQSAAATERIRVINAGYRGSVTYTGWDGATTDRGPWRLDVLTIDPRTFRGTLDATYGPDIENRETVSALARRVPEPSPRSTRASSSSTPAPAHPATRRASACSTGAC